MSETQYVGWVVKRHDYMVFDEIITFLTDSGRLISCVGLGTKKIDSKNGRSLFLGNYIEFQIFESHTNGKLSKLKKVITLEQMNWNCESFESFQLLHECVVANTPETWDRVSFYKKYLYIYQHDLNLDQYLILKILKDMSILNGLNIEVNKCILCGSQHLKTISFKHHGMLCNLCYAKEKPAYFNLEITKCFHFLYTDSLQTKQYAQHFGIVIKLLKQYLFDNMGIVFNSLNNY